MAETEKQKDIYILGIESSCDETAASVVKNGREVLSNVISSQIALHTLYGGVVPEIASRKHIEKINQVIEQALADAHVTLEDITAIAVTYGPGLVGALLVGVSEAKAISFATGIPLVGVHHIEGHISANFIENKELEPPFICLVRPAATHIWWWSRITVNMRSSDGPEMMRREKLLTRWLVPSDWDIPAVPRLTRCRRRAIRMPSTSPEQQWRRMNMISASAV